MLSSSYVDDKDFKVQLNIYGKTPPILYLVESPNVTALNRILDFLNNLEHKYSNKTILISSHGNIIGILLNYFDSTFDYKQWEGMTFPDCFIINKNSIKRIMKKILKKLTTLFA